MMVIFVSQCEKNALKKTRKVLDTFANRIGDNTWQTLITKDGLEAVLHLLKKTASRSTAVSCHWFRSRSRCQLLWVVGNKDKFNHQGYVAVNRTEKDLCHSEYENDWKYLPLIKSLSALAALLHDWGKASKLFQNKLKPNSKNKYKSDPFRHEWVSCLLFYHFIVGNHFELKDETWLQAFIDGHIDESHFKGNVFTFENGKKKPLTDLPNAALLISWLIVSHHRLPLPKEKELSNILRESSNDSIKTLLNRVTQDWGYANQSDDFDKRLKQCLEFPNGLLTHSKPWLKQLQRRAGDLLAQLPLLEQAMSDGSWRIVLHHARLCLMLGDHFYSSQDKNADWQKDCKLFANTDPKTKELKQRLDEHLVGVEKATVNAVKMLPLFESKPLRATDLPELKPKKDTAKKFQWQDKAVKKINHWREKTKNNDQGYFVVNMASTGTGKTIANAKIMQALSEDKVSLRFILALGLRTLTLQTGDEYKKKLKIKDSDLAVLIGSKAIYQLHQNGQIQDKDELDLMSHSGSESSEDLQEQTDELRWDDSDWKGVLPEEELTTVLRCEKDRKLLYAPVLACTIDSIMAATETKRGRRYILPCLRLMSSDLVIDEVDDFMGDDLIAIGRLVYLAGMLGRKVMISSATISPDFALGFFNAYRQGWALFASSRDKRALVNSVWVDEFNTIIQSVGSKESDINTYQTYHSDFVSKRIINLIAQKAKRKAIIYRCPKTDNGSYQTQYFEHIQDAVLQLHSHNFTQGSDKKINISFGVIRVANIKPCVDLTEFFLDCDWPDDTEIRCMAYHSQQVLLLRNEQEKHLDHVVRRKEEPGKPLKAFSDPLINAHIQNCQSKNLIFILVATPVEEVGRDHDFDWAVIEPSSYRSIIQLAGRVRRHRDTEVELPNIAIMQYNLKGFEGKEELVFCRPGYETSPSLQLSTYDVTKLVDEAQLLKSVDAIARIQKNKLLAPKTSLIDLEHHVTAKILGIDQINLVLKEEVKTNRFQQKRKSAEKVFWSNHLHGHLSDFWWLTALPQHFKRFRSSAPSVLLYLTIEGNKLIFQQKDKQGQMAKIERILQIEHYQLSEKQMKRLWMERDYKTLINALDKENNDEAILFNYAEISFTDWGKSSQYRYNNQLGLVKK